MMLLLGAAAALGVALYARSRRAVPPSSPPRTVTAAPAASETEPALHEAIARSPRDPDAHRALARALLEDGRPFTALWHFRTALDLRPGDTDTPGDLARALVRAGLPALAVARLKEQLAREPAALEARRALAEAHLAAARPREALAALQAAGAALAASAPGQRLLGDARFALGDMAGARAAYQRAAAMEPGGAAAWDRLGRLALAMGEWEAARTALLAAREREPEAVGIAYRLGQAYWESGEREAAEAAWAEIAAAAPGYAPARLALGRAYRQRRRWREAATELAAALEADPGRVEAQAELAAVMEAMGQPSSALYQRGLFYLQTDRPLKALDCYRRMAAAHPASTSAPLMASFCWMRVKRYQEAGREAERGLRAHPDDPALRQRVAQLYLLTGNARAAQAFCREWLNEEPAAAEPHRLLGRAALNASRPAEAIAHYERAVALDPGNAEYHLELGKALAEAVGSGQSAAGSSRVPPGRDMTGPAAPSALTTDHRPLTTVSAEAALRRAVALAPRHAEARRHLGLLLHQQGRPDGARDALLRALDLDPNLTAAASALVAVAHGQGAAALRPPTPTRPLSSTSTSMSRSTKGEGLGTSGLPPSAPSHARLFSEVTRILQARGREREALERQVGLHPKDAAAHEQLARLRAEAGDLRRAAIQWEQLAALRPRDAGARQQWAVARRLVSLGEP
jgi:tetratricopeptide (TPR) repeat protein